MNKRVDGIDVIKGICILTVVLCHTLTFSDVRPEFLSAFLSAIFLNDFFFVSGWVYALKDTKGEVRKYGEISRKIKSLGIPYILLSGIAIVYHIIIVGVLNNPYVSVIYSGKQLIMRDIFCTISLLGIGTLWFLPILIICSVILLLLMKINNKKLRYGTIMFVIIVCVIGYYCMEEVSYLNSMNNFWGKVISEEIVFMERIFTGLIYTFAGYILGNIYNISQKSKILIFLISIIGLSLGILMYINNMQLYIVMYSLSFPILIIYLFENKYLSKIAYPIRYCGEKSLEIMYIHYIIVYPIMMQFLGNAFKYSNLGNAIGIINFITVLIVTIVLVWLGNYSKIIRFIFGRSRQFKRYIRN